ncbi:MAG: DUF1549 domain-containing protein [Planctomycetes bacterium]|nr:DUF1549 domain-containing protein [Planctomycetota bacterium]
MNLFKFFLLIISFVTSHFFVIRAHASTQLSDSFSKASQVLLKNCVSCHSSAGKIRGGLDLSSIEKILEGGITGQVLVPGRSAESLLIQMIMPGRSPHMPPKGQLSKDEIEILSKWVDGLNPSALKNKSSGKDHWAFKKLEAPAVPGVDQNPWGYQPLDAFVLASLDAKGLKPSPIADKTTLIRRAYFDLTGLPPSPYAIQKFLNDTSVNSFEKVIDELLASPAYGERWGRHWLDLTRYADSGGFHNDVPRTNAWRYRDYVIKSINEDKPFAQFIREQLAGDEIENAGDEQLIATGFGRNGPSNDDNMGKTPQDIEKYRLDELDGVINTTFTTFLGLTLGCARCHDHKYDPISQKDYYQVLAIFNGTSKKDLPLAGNTIEKGKLKDPERGIMALIDSMAQPKPTHILWRGDLNNPGPIVKAAVPSVLTWKDWPIPDVAKNTKSSKRRLALADWIASPENPLTYRVLANRFWQHHFGRGLVETSGNFGRSGALSSNPDLLDHLATCLVNNGGQWKNFHKYIMLSATYQQSSSHVAECAVIDPENHLHWRQNKRRLEAEAIRDSILSISDSINLGMGGPGVKPRIRSELLPASQRNKWPLIAREGPEHWRRSVYIYSKRQLLFPLLDLFDAPNTTDVCDCRLASIVPTQALLLMNDEFVDDQARRFAESLLKKHGSDLDILIQQSCYRALGRFPSSDRVHQARTFMDQRILAYRESKSKTPEFDAIVDLCHVLFNTNEFVFID